MPASPCAGLSQSVCETKQCFPKDLYDDDDEDTGIGYLLPYKCVWYQNACRCPTFSIRKRAIACGKTNCSERDCSAVWTLYDDDDAYDIINQEYQKFELGCRPSECMPMPNCPTGQYCLDTNRMYNFFDDDEGPTPAPPTNTCKCFPRPCCKECVAVC